MEERTYMTIQEAADYIRVSTKTLRRWIYDGRLLARQLGPGTVRVLQEDLDALADGTLADTGEDE